MRLLKRLLFVGFFVFFTFLNISVSNACVVEPSSQYYDKTGSDLKTIHNRLVDQNVVGYNVYCLYNFVYEYSNEGECWEFKDVEDFSGFLNNKFVGDYLIVSGLKDDDDLIYCDGLYSYKNDGISYNYLLDCLLHSFGFTFSVSSELIRSYTSFNVPFGRLNEVFGFNYLMYESLLLSDVESFYNSIDSSLYQCNCDSCLNVCKEQLKNSFIIEYIPSGYDCFDNSLYLLNDGDIISKEPSIVINNCNIISNIDGEYVVYNNVDVPISINDIQASLSGYDCYGCSLTILRDYEEEKKYFAYDEKNVLMGDSFLCFKSVDDFDNVSKKVVKIKTSKIDYVDYFSKDNCRYLTLSYFTYDMFNEYIFDLYGVYPSKIIGYLYDGDKAVNYYNSEDKIYNKKNVCNIFYYVGRELKCFAFSNGLENFVDFNSYKIVSYNKSNLKYEDVVSLIKSNLKLDDLKLYGYAYDTSNVYIFDDSSSLDILKKDVCVSYYIGEERSQVYKCVISYEYSKDVEIVSKTKKWYQFFVDFIKRIIDFIRRLFGGVKND